MPVVDLNRLKGSYGAACVSARLSSECLVRTVSEGTDIGVDLYCETVAEGKPFLHFWVQVKAGDQCKVEANRDSASCSFSKDKLDYWSQQPVPVFAALVPTDWPPSAEPPIYVVDITSQLLQGNPVTGKSKTLYSDFVWQPGVRSDVADFLEKAVPLATARMQCKNGLVASIPTPAPSYEIAVPWVPIALYKENISEQIRRTAANGILFLYEANEIRPYNDDFRRRLAGILEGYGEDPHWETWMGRAISYHADTRFRDAVVCYEKARNSIKGDPNVRDKANWRRWVELIEALLKGAEKNSQLQYPP